MPNHVKNVLKFKNLKPKESEFLINLFTSPVSEDPTGKAVDLIFDFDKVIPEPREKSECPEDCLVNKDSHVMEYPDRPWFDWYEWHNKYWGTKWNAYDGYTKAGRSYITFVFSSAWSAPFPVIERLRLLGYDFELRYADEDYGSNCGKMIYEPSKTGFKDIVRIGELDLTNSGEFAKNLWRKY